MMPDWLPDFEHVPPRAIKRLLSGVLWEGTPDSGSMALTFDDGPDPEITPLVLDTLDEIGARGTFFLIGGQARNHPALARSIVERGHLTGSHSMTHPRLFLMKRSEVEYEIDEAGKAIADATGREPVLFRPPYGTFDFTVARVLREREMDLVLWTVLSGDYDDPDEQTVLKRLDPFIRPGAVAVFHDTARGGGRGLGDILRRINAEARDRCVRLGGVDELSIADDIALDEDHAG